MDPLEKLEFILESVIKSKKRELKRGEEDEKGITSFKRLSLWYK